MLRGLLAVVPIVLCYFAVRFLYLAVDQRVAPLIEKRLGANIPGLGFLLVLIILYLVGLITSNWLGRQFFAMIEHFTARIPVLKSIYGLGKQIERAFSLPDRSAFRRVVMVEFLRPGLWSIGFVAGEVADTKAGGKLLKVFIPTAPNPTAGFMVLVREETTRALNWTVQEAMNAIVSGGVIGPASV